MINFWLLVHIGIVLSHKVMSQPRNKQQSVTVVLSATGVFWRQLRGGNWLWQMCFHSAMGPIQPQTRKTSSKDSLEFSYISYRHESEILSPAFCPKLVCIINICWQVFFTYIHTTCLGKKSLRKYFTVTLTCFSDWVSTWFQFTYIPQTFLEQQVSLSTMPMTTSASRSQMGEGSSSQTGSIGIMFPSSRHL